ncbi:MAG: Hsp20/alpha crystallin family protein [Chitinophagaceae bacterium]|nr:MAG: Hsp20/alpha crystallin family protein [Chitinophagaceae bacterium]
MKLLKSNSNLFPSVFSDFFGMDDFFDNFSVWDNDAWLPATNIKEDEKSYGIELAVPGMKKEDITLEVDNGTLTVSGKSKEEKEEEKDTYIRKEYKSSAFVRSFSLPDNVNEEKITSRYEDGILKIKVDKKDVAVKKEKKAIAIS